MKNVLYISNIEVPYRTEFFNQLSKKVNLTVLYERKKSSNRDSNWTSSIKSNYDIKYLNGFNINNEYTFDIRILKEVFSKKYEKIIIGCCNSPSQMLAILLMKILKKKYILNLDGEYFLDGNSIKKKIKRFFVKGADEYLIAGEKSGENLAKYVPKDKIHPYYFSSLTKKELEFNSKHLNKNINDSVLVVGQYFDVKGLDIALEIAKLDKLHHYKFIGSGYRSDLLKSKVIELKLNNVEVIPFLQKKDLYKEYQNCKCVLFPSRQECWGLVINEAASFGCPIIASLGSGAAVEFFSGIEEKVLFDVNRFSDALLCLFNEKIYEESFRKNLIKTSSEYYIEKNVEIFFNILSK